MKFEPINNNLQTIIILIALFQCNIMVSFHCPEKTPLHSPSLWLEWKDGECNCVQPMPHYLHQIERVYKLTCLPHKVGGRNAQYCVCAFLVCTGRKASFVAPLCGGCTPTADGVGSNRPHLFFCAEPFGLEQHILGIASVPQETKQFTALSDEWACKARQAEAKHRQQEEE